MFAMCTWNMNLTSALHSLNWHSQIINSCTTYIRSSLCQPFALALSRKRWVTDEVQRTLLSQVSILATSSHSLFVCDPT